MCPKCGSKADFIKKSWSRTEAGEVGNGESAIEYKKFISRSTVLKCRDCGYKFLKYTTTQPKENPFYDVKKLDSELLLGRAV